MNYETHYKPESALSFKDNVAFDIMNVSSVQYHWKGTKQMCRLQWDTLKTGNHHSTRKRGIKKHDIGLSTKQDDSQTALWKKKQNLNEHKIFPKGPPITHTVVKKEMIHVISTAVLHNQHKHTNIVEEQQGFPLRWVQQM